MTTITRAELTKAAHRTLGLSRQESAEIVDMVLKEVCDTLARGETVKLSGFATFTVYTTPQRIGRNPKNGDEVLISARRAISFKAANGLKRRVNQQKRKEK